MDQELWDFQVYDNEPGALCEFDENNFKIYIGFANS